MLHETHILRNGPVINPLSNTPHRSTELCNELVVNTEVNVDLASNGCLQSYNNWSNVESTINLNACNAIHRHLPQICERSISVETSERDVDSTLHINGRHHVSKILLYNLTYHFVSF